MRGWAKPIIDGALNESSWQNAQWSENFVDIVGKEAARPNKLTRTKMLWDENYLCFAAYPEEDNIWADLKIMTI